MFIFHKTDLHLDTDTTFLKGSNFKIAASFKMREKVLKKGNIPLTDLSNYLHAYQIFLNTMPVSWQYTKVYNNYWKSVQSENFTVFVTPLTISKQLRYQ